MTKNLPTGENPICLAGRKYLYRLSEGLPGDQARAVINKAADMFARCRKAETDEEVKIIVKEYTGLSSYSLAQERDDSKETGAEVEVPKAPKRKKKPKGGTKKLKRR